MSVSAFLKLIIGVLETFAQQTNTVIDDQVLNLMRAIDASPAMLAWIEQFVPIQAALPPGVLAQSDLTAMPKDVQQMISPDKMALLTTILSILIDLYRKYNAPPATMVRQQQGPPQ